jgi:hypothetical protein
MGFIATKNNLGARLFVGPEEVFHLRFDDVIHLLKRGIFTLFSRGIKPVTFIANADYFDKAVLGKPIKLCC